MSPPSRPVPAATFGRNFGRYKDEAIARGVVEVSSNGRPVGAYLSQEEYERFCKLKRRSEDD
ncbi:type II toxin-antitoxin system prevent-host-death family antitoxin [Yoonia sp. SS1-5]|uniref:Type II toxin-antitoxin system prevent-host-death family antitoxin n=1 Tax=Yoonia rhodophyticola TaxID=3137370 RepID=A0ABZ3JCP7_9RHOB